MLCFIVRLYLQRHSKVCFQLLQTFRGTPERPCPNRGVALQSRAAST